jgi:serine/threonine-protein kinase
MAIIYVGRGVSDDGKEELVALKVMRDEYGHDPKFLRMFSDEAKILAKLSHPNVIRTLEYGITSEHRFIVMELLAGRTLWDLWESLSKRGERLAFEIGAWICARVAEGLHAAHELTDNRGESLNVVHRDVNPSNIFLTHAGEVKLIDFGLAKARVRRERTVGGIVKGKMAYLAPEQITTMPIDRRIDIYALGITLWEVGAMARLFKRDTDIATLRAIRDAEVPDLRTVVKGYPNKLAEMVAHALEPDRDKRYATAADLQHDLDAFAAGHLGSPKHELQALISRLFPGELAKHSTWTRDAIAVKVMATVPPPPMPVPIASSNLVIHGAPETIELDEADIEVVKPPRIPGRF